MNAKANNTDKTQELCEKLYLAAKKSKTRRFHALYDKVYRSDILSSAWDSVRANRGAAGVDNETIDDILQNKDEILTHLQHTLQQGKYRPRKLRRVYIPKPDGERPLAIPTVRDRIIQTATKQVIEPIFEADFLDCSYGFRPNRCAHDALEKVRTTMNSGYTIVLDADIKQFFDNIDHDKLLELVHNRISDRRILKLIRKWLKAGVMDSGVAEQTEIGTPQGGVISPLLANIYLHELDKFWTQQIVNGHLIRYADDFVILFKTREDAELGLQLIKAKLNELHLELNEDKTRIVDTTKGKGFDFLGFHHRRLKSKTCNKYYAYKWPSAKSVKAFKAKIKSFLGKRSILNWNIEDVVQHINPVITGWMNYYKYGNSARIFSQLDNYLHERMALWWNKKHQKSGRRWKVYNWERHKSSKIQILSGSIQYWSALRMREKEGYRKAV